MRYFLVFALMLVCLPGAARSKEMESDMHLSLARVLVGEADGSKADWAAILWTLRHRSQITKKPLSFIVRYSAVLRGESPRSRRILTLGTPTPDLGVLPLVRARQWEEALQFVELWRVGKVADPCPQSMHWRGVDDESPLDKVAVDCGGTANEFFFRRGESRR